MHGHAAGRAPRRHRTGGTLAAQQPPCTGRRPAAAAPWGGGAGRGTQCGGRLARHAAAFDVDAWRRGFCEVEDLKDGFYFLEGVAGVPEDLRGTYFRNGPGNFVVSGAPILHPLDGDGLMLAVSFCGDGKVCVRHRFVQTQGFLRDRFEKRIVAPGVYGTQPQGGKLLDIRKLSPKNPANVGALWWEERLLALSPVGKPFEVEPASLGTVLGSEKVGATNLGGALDEKMPFGATPRVCASSGSLVNFAQVSEPFETTVQFFEFPKGQWKTRYKTPRTVKVKSYTNFADFAVTPTWFVLAQPPLRSDTFGAALGKPMPEVLDFDPGRAGELLFVSRAKEGEREVVVPVDGLVCEEWANAYELEDGRVVLDAVTAERWDIGRPSGNQPLWQAQDPSSRPRTRLVRYEVDLAKGSWMKRDLCDLHVSFTSVSPGVVGKKHRYVFCAVAHGGSAAGPAAGVAKIDVETGAVDTWVPGPAEFGGQPVFVPRPGGSAEDDGYLVSVVFDGEAQRSDVVVLDARSVAQGPVCRFPLKAAVPHGLRGCWAPGLALTEEEMRRKVVLLRMFTKKSQEWNAASSSFNIFAKDAFFEKQGGRLR